MNNKQFKLSILTSLIFVSLYSYGDDYFDPSMLESQLGIDSSQIDVSHFNKSSNNIPVGNYIIQVKINQNTLGDQSINFTPDENDKIRPELTPKLLSEWGVNVKSIPNLRELPDDTKILNIGKYIKDATVSYDFSKLQLIVSVPQIAMSDKSQGYIDPSLLDNGIPALFVNYFLSGSNRRDSSENSSLKSTSNVFLTTQNGVNLGAWRLRSTMSYTYNKTDDNANSETHFSGTYIMRTLQSIRSKIFAGELSAGGEVFDSFPLKGIRLVSDEEMLPGGERGFAPEITGIAQSNARVTVRQNGGIVYQTYVAPGAFRLKDIYSAGNSGDLDVTVTEENGTEKMFTVAFSSLPVMLRPGGYKYELAAGRYDGGYTKGSKEAEFVIGTFSYGLPINTTLYGGVLASKNYISLSGGTGLSLGAFGAVSVDITQANARPDGNFGDKSGQSYRMRYSKSMTTTGTSVDLTALRYSTRDYFSFSDFNSYNYQLKDNISPWSNQRQRSSFTTSLSQSLGEYGNIYISGSLYDYWETDQKMRQVSLGYNGTFKQINYSVNYTIDRLKDKNNWPENRQIAISVNIPLSVFSSSAVARDMSSSYSFRQDNNSNYSHQMTLSGMALDNKLSYGISQGYTNTNNVYDGSINGSYSGSKGNVSAGYNYSQDYQSVNASVNGGLLVHSGGILTGRSMGDSMAIIDAQGAEGTKTNNSETVINSSGYALYPYMSPYNANIISLDVNTLPSNVMLTETTKTVYPAAGAIVKVKFNTKVGYQAIIDLKAENGMSIPFGAVATLKEENEIEENTGIVGEKNQLFMSGLPQEGKINIGWGNAQSQNCTATYSGLQNITENSNTPIRSISVLCR